MNSDPKNSDPQKLQIDDFMSYPPKCIHRKKSSLFPTLIFSYTFQKMWLDERFRWNKGDFNNLDKVRLPCNRIWVN